MIFIKDSTGKPSITMTAFVLGFIVVNCKLVLSGLTIAGQSMGEFSGVDYSAALSALGAIYIMRRREVTSEHNQDSTTTDEG